MKSLEDLRNPDVITINGEQFQVLKHFELFFDDLKKELSMCVELTKCDSKNISSDVRLVYIKGHSDTVKLLKYDSKTDRFLESELNSLEFN